MAFSIKNLGEGQLTNSEATLYTVPALTTALVKTITLVNTDSSARTCNIFLRPGATSRLITPEDVSIGAGEMLVIDLNFTLEAGDLVRGFASVTTVVDYTISGIESA